MNITISRRKMKGGVKLDQKDWVNIQNVGNMGVGMTISNHEPRPLYYKIKV